MSAELDEKTALLCRLMADEDLAGILINSQPNFAWLTCGGSNGVDQSRENGVASILVSKDGARFILASRIEMPRMLAEVVSPCDFDPVEFAWQDEKADPGLVARLAASVAGGRVGIDSDFETRIASCGYSLTDDELERYRSLGRDAAAAVSSVAKRLEGDLSEIEIAERIRAALASANIVSVVTLVAVDERIARFRHPVPTAKRFEKTALLVTCARRGGLTASLSRMVSIGEADGEIVRRTEAAAFVNASLLASTRKGISGSELYRIAADAYSKAGFEDEIDLHHQGGATGYRTRDWVAHPCCGETVRKRQAFAWNPSIMGTKIEDTVVVIDDEIEVLTSTPEFPAIGEEYRSAGIFSI